ncbi:MAG TPA: prolyl oligopeptidase family serine peptidase [Candidatus Angelobacter sp.]|nr:prolyl oligopeptidase family serine peptidase [Candidatus Angelobacter sp.]
MESNDTARFAELLLLMIVQCASMATSQSAPKPAGQPVAPVRAVTTDYFGTKVVDAYRYMEDTTRPEVQKWMKAQNDYTRAVLAGIPGRARLLARIQELDQSVPDVSTQRLPGGLYLIMKRNSNENVAKLYVRRGLSGKDRVLIDPEKVQLTPPNRGKGSNAILYCSPSQDGKYVAVGIAPGGSEHDTEMHVFETATGHETGDVILHAWAAASDPKWLPRNKSFIYNRLQTLPSGAPVTEIEQKVRAYLHVLGTKPTADLAVFGYDVVPTIQVDPTHFASVQSIPGSDYALGIISTGVSPNSAFYIARAEDVAKINTPWRKIADFSDDVTNIAVHGSDIFILTYKGAIRDKVIRTSVLNPDLTTAETVVAQSQSVITGINAAEDALYVQVLDAGIGRLLRVPYRPKAEIQEVTLPFKGRISVDTDPRLPGAVLNMTSWTKASAIYIYDPATNHVKDTGLQPAGPYGNPSNIESVEVKVRSDDGMLIPLSIIYPKSMKLDGSNPTWLSGYGAYGVSSSPFFTQLFLAWYEHGGIYAVCHVRGGGEYGEAWHQAGKGPTKSNTWMDFIVCAQYLIRHRYTSAARLAGSGMSAGGIMIGRAITARPDLFAAAIDWVGLSDMLRFEATANGVPNIPEFGTVKTKAGFEALYAMSPYVHIKDNTPYPAVLFITGANDPRVDSWQMAKMAARLQAATSSAKPVLLRISYQGGHGSIGGKETEFQDILADICSFLLWQFGLSEFQPGGNVAGTVENKR